MTRTEKSYLSFALLALSNTVVFSADGQLSKALVAFLVACLFFVGFIYSGNRHIN